MKWYVVHPGNSDPRRLVVKDEEHLHPDTVDAFERGHNFNRHDWKVTGPFESSADAVKMVRYMYEGNWAAWGAGGSQDKELGDSRA